VRNPDTLGLVLAGGRARRMAGADKMRIRIGHATMLERVIASLVPQCRELILSIADPESPYAAAGLPTVTDAVGGYAGPLAGILAGLDWAAAKQPQTQWVASVPGDCPFLPRDLVRRLHEARVKESTTLACASSGGRRHPVIALWPVALRDDLRRALVDEKLRKVDGFTARYTVATVEWPAAPIDPFFNVNTPDDAAAAARLAEQFPDI
jgi:molybdenum cofactor guanylyltransferase